MLISVGKDVVIGGTKFVLIAGPCVIEDYETCYVIASSLKQLCIHFNVPLIFKASYDKANRTSANSFRGPGVDKGLRILNQIKLDLGLPVTSDVHCKSEVPLAADVLDIIQIPAFLCRQTDLIQSAAKTGKPINVKKGQWMNPRGVGHIVDKAKAVGNHKVMITERGTFFGYNELVNDFRSIPIIQSMGIPVVFDATHSVQCPGSGSTTGGDTKYVSSLARAAIAVGVQALFLEVYVDGKDAPCDASNSLCLDELPGLLNILLRIQRALM